MATYTVNNTMSDLTYELSEREIYNDIRSEIGVTVSETVVDADANYTWKVWHRYGFLPAPGYTNYRYFTATVQTPLAWAVQNVSVYDQDRNPYYDYEYELEDTNDDLTKAFRTKNTGIKYGSIEFEVKYKYLSAEEVSHEEYTHNTLQVRAADNTSIDKYGRRVMNLIWPQGTEEADMQGLVDADLARYKEPYARLVLTLIGKDATNQAIIYGAEISDIMTVTCTKLGLTATSYFIDAISIKDNLATIPIGTFELVAKRTVESTGFFVIDTDSIDGSKLIA